MYSLAQTKVLKELVDEGFAGKLEALQESCTFWYAMQNPSRVFQNFVD